jgi:hypothetical protein
MTTDRSLSLHHEVTLLSLKDEAGTPEFGAHHRMAIGAAILAELLLQGRVKIEQDRKKQFARVVSRKTLNDELLDEALARMAESKRRQQLSTWVSRFANTRDLTKRSARQLCRMGVLREDEDRVLLIFKRRIFPEIDPRPERAIIARLKKAIDGAGSVDPRTVTLIAIAQAANVLKNAVDKKRLKERKARLKKITSGDATGEAAGAAIQAAQAAAAMTVIIASTVATTAATTAATS